MKKRGPSYSVIGKEKSFTGKPISQIKLDKVKGATFSLKPKNLIKNKIKGLIASKPLLVNMASYFNLGFQGQLVGYDPSQVEEIDKPMSPRLINWIEPYEISGERKTLFYTEVNSGLKVGDRVFIINGNYDSDLLIKQNKYKRGRDGYKVLFVDKCQIVLDIDYTGVMPYSVESDDEYLNIYYLDNEDDFRWAEKSFSTRTGTFSRKFNYYQNNIVYTNKNYGPINVWGRQTKIQEAPGFFVRNNSDTLGLDNSLDIGDGFGYTNSSVNVSLLQSTLQKLIVGGKFNTYNGNEQNNIVSLTFDGVVDNTFIAGTTSPGLIGFNGPVFDIKQKSTISTNYYICGSFSQYGGTTTQRIVSINSIGNKNTSFSTNQFPNGEIRNMCILSGGLMAVGGTFSKISGTTTHQNILLLSSTSGLLSSTFNSGSGTKGTDGPVNVIKDLVDISGSYLIVGGDFTSYNSQSALRIAKVSLGTSIIGPTGSLDPSFNSNLGSGFGGKINDLIITSNKIIAVGDFDSFDGLPYGKIVSLNLDGTLDTSFNSGIGFDKAPNSIKIDSDKIYIGGNFTTYNGQTAKQLIRISLDGTLDNSFDTGFGLNNGVNHINLIDKNLLYIGGNFTTYNNVDQKNFAKISFSPWVSITHDFVAGSFSLALSPTSSVNRIKIHNGSFTYSINNEVVDFNEGVVYKYDMSEEPNAVRGSFSTWVTDVTVFKPVITKTNFRDGNFNGLWNVGLFGRQNKKIKWTGEKSTWQTGTLLNSIWEKGTLNSKYSLNESYFTEFDEFGLPSQKLNTPNNAGKGFNFIIDSEIQTGVLQNSTIINSVLGSDTATFSIVENILKSIPITNTVEVKKAYFEETEIRNSVVKNSELKNIRSKNSSFENVRSVNSYYKKSYMKNSDYTSDNTVKVVDYDEFNISEYFGGIGSSHKVYKFYISERDYSRFRLNDTFYIKGLNFNNGSKNILNLFDKRFKIGSWNEFLDSLNSQSNINTASYGSENIAPYDTFYKRGVDIAAFLSTPQDNSYTYNTINKGITYSTLIVGENAKKGYSIDIVLSIKDRDFNIVNSLNFNRDVNSFTVYDETTMFFGYYADGTYYEEIVKPSGYTNSKPIYTLTRNTGFTYSVIFWDDVIPSQYSWHHYQNYSPIFGGFGDYYETLNEPGNLPINASYSWQVSIDENVGIITSTAYNPSPILSDYLGNIIDINNTYIIDSDFESGQIERSNWNSGYIISPSNDSNLTNTNIQGGTYNLEVFTSSSSVLVTTTFDKNFREREQDFYKVGDIVYLNSVNYDTTGKIVNFQIVASGSGYLDDTLPVSGTYGQGAEFLITTGSSSEVTSASLVKGGSGYRVGDVLTLLNGTSVSGKIQVLSTTGSIISLPDTYKIISKVDNKLEIEEVYATYSKLSSLLDGGISYTKDALNRYGYLHTVKLNKNLFKKGLLKRVYSYNNLFQNKELNLIDKDFLNLNQFRDLLLSDILFANNKNILSKASYVNSSFTIGDDIWNDGLFYNSIWNGGVFTKGLVKDSTWINGLFETGTFYESRSFNATPDTTYRNYDTDRIKSYYKSGITSATISNDRHSWRNGTFSSGEFLKSDWENGNFKNGKFYYSKWYSGTFSKGTIGDITLSLTDTWFYNGLIKTAVVENANLYAIDTSYTGASTSAIVWETGVFNAGAFGCDILIQKTSSHTALWKTGTFNGGEFQTNGKWLTGTFNNGKFISGFGWTYSPNINTLSTSQSQFGWETGVFNDGEFGTAERGTNSIWWSGEFNGGKFQGRLWNDGVLTKGQFIGGSTYSAVGGYNVDVFSASNANDFMLSFTSDFWGIWRNGIVTIEKDEYVTDKKVFSVKTRSIFAKKPLNVVKFENMLWMDGVFSHSTGTINNSLWIGGHFSKGVFKSSSFNPYVKKQGPGSPESFNLFDNLKTGEGNCVWYDGTLEQSDFYISQWYNGNFISGTAFGMVWKNGSAKYMNAYNTFWEDGVWRNGNWFGSYIKVEVDGGVSNEFHRQLLLRGMNWLGTASTHLWNVFDSSSESLDSMGEKSATSSVSYVVANGLSLGSVTAVPSNPVSGFTPNPPVGNTTPTPAISVTTKTPGIGG